jgi:hypothetical protein
MKRVYVKVLIKLTKLYLSLNDYIKGQEYLALLKKVQVDEMDSRLWTRYRELKCLYYLEMAFVDKLIKHVDKLKKHLKKDGAFNSYYHYMKFAFFIS